MSASETEVDERVAVATKHWGPRFVAQGVEEAAILLGHHRGELGGRLRADHLSQPGESRGRPVRVQVQVRLVDVARGIANSRVG